MQMENCSIKYAFGFFMAIALHTIAFAQKDSTIRRLEPASLPGVELNYIYQKSHGFEVGINYLTAKSKMSKVNWSLYEYGPSIASEFIFYNESLIVGPKLSYRHYNFFKKFPGIGYTFKANAIYYISKDEQDLNFTPEVGLSWVSLLNVYYGYNISLTDNAIEGISRHKLTVSVNLNAALLLHSLPSAMGY
jgi:hypothetical protein